jgi:uncharacterized protein YdhG (YjbR/CyaY superfamily)
METEIDHYISKFPFEVQENLNQIRTLVKKSAPGATESMAYGMPAYKLNGRPLVYFAGFKNHIGFYATPTGHEAFKKELSGYKQGRGSLQFPLNQPVPYDLIEQIVLFRVAENEMDPKRKK